MINKLLLGVATTLFVVISVTACSTNNTPTQTITEKNYQALCDPLNLKVNQEFLVVLPSSFTTGYQWQIEEEASSILQLTKNRIKKDKDPDNHLHQLENIWRFKAVKPGRANLTFIYHLAWDANIEDRQRVQCDIIVNNY